MGKKQQPKFQAVTMTDEEYFAHPAISRSGLWTLYNKTPAHFHGAEDKDENDTALKLGTLTHCAILRPNAVEREFVVGPEARGNSNIWKEAAAAAEAAGKLIVKKDEFEMAMRMRDSAHSHPLVAALAKESINENVMLWEDEEFQVGMKCKVDAYSPRLAIIGDIKTTVSAKKQDFAWSIARYGYHMQEAVYTEGWRRGFRVDGFVFVAIEKTAPYITAIYELEQKDVTEGWLAYRKALLTYKNCVHEQSWPGYHEGVEKISLPLRAIRELAEDMDQAA
jgi:hypothetical protein